ncbi:MAG TPA: hypothetical protein VIV11_19765 [Kofleriaceae bacterium]
MLEPDDEPPRPPKTPVAETIGIILVAFVMIGIQLATGIQGLWKGVLLVVVAAAALMYLLRRC